MADAASEAAAGGFGHEGAATVGASELQPPRWRCYHQLLVVPQPLVGGAASIGVRRRRAATVQSVQRGSGRHMSLTMGTPQVSDHGTTRVLFAGTIPFFCWNQL